jgi:hypothetical protein
MASAIMLPISTSPLAEILQLGDHRLDGEIDAALQVHRVHPRGHRLGALAHDRLGQDRRRGGAVTGDVVGLGGDLAHHLRTHVLELVAKLDLLGDGDAVLGRARRPEGLVEHHVAPLGAEGHLDRVGQDIDAPQHARAGIGSEFDIFCSHLTTSSLLKYAHDVALAHDQEGLAVQLDLGSRPFAVKHGVALFDIQRLQLAVIASASRADRGDFSLHRLFLGRIGNDNAAGGLLFLLERLDHDTVV